VILVDANLLIYAVVRGYPQHDVARRWLDAQLSGADHVGIPWASALAVVRQLVDPKAYEEPLSLAAAWEVVSRWLHLPSVWIPRPTDRHQSILAEIFSKLPGGRKIVADAHLAALAIEHELILCTNDRGFQQFQRFGLKAEYPVISELL
jgi:toxin-antitoxin system PIN domain toxin